jgi:hypothetical protein
MPKLRLSLAGTVILALLSGVGSAVAAQTTDDEALDPMRPSHFTMTTSEHVSDSGEPVWGPGPGYGQSLGNEMVAIMEASDSRIGGTWTQVLDIRAFPIDEQAGDFALVWSGVVRIENDGGAWAGALDGYHTGTLGREWNRLEGEGAYEGLTAVFRYVEEGDAYEGVIIPGVPPDYPAPITPGESAVEE